MNMVTVRINGLEYNLKGEEREEYLHTVASYVDKKVKSILENNSKLSTSSAAMLTAINVVDEMFKYQASTEELMEKLEKVQGENQSLLELVDSLKKQLKHIEAYNEELCRQMKNSENAEAIKLKENEIEKMQKELEIMQEATKKQIETGKRLREENKELKFHLQSAKYKVIDLQHRLVENQICLAKEKKRNDPLGISHKE